MPDKTTKEEKSTKEEATVEDAPITKIAGGGEDLYAPAGPSASADPNGGEQAAANQEALAGTAGETPEDAVNPLAEEEEEPKAKSK